MLANLLFLTAHLFLKIGEIKSFRPRLSAEKFCISSMISSRPFHGEALPYLSAKTSVTRLTALISLLAKVIFTF
ncbi:hypothetical protein, partial [Lactococcus lactis]|uniref:hypothetical protein n=1 Tax=Lactococcus lactis TaxID=1358 RepID=UPI0025A213D6